MQKIQLLSKKIINEYIIVIICLVFSIFFIFIIKQYTLERLTKNGMQQLAGIRAHLEHTILTAVNPVAALHSFVEAEGGMPQDDEFIKFTKSLHASTPSLMALQLAPDGIVMLTTNSKQNAKAIGHDLFKDPYRRDQFLRAVYNNQTIVTGPVTLIQGGEAIIVRKPIYIKGTNSRTGIKDFFGLSIAVIDMEEIYRSINVNWEIYALRGRHGLGEYGNIFHGKSEIFDNENIQMEISLPTGKWIIAKRAPVFRDYAKEITFALLLAMFISSIIVFVFAERIKTNKIIQSKNQRLHVASVIGNLGFIEVLDDHSFDLSPDAKRILEISDKDMLPKNVQVVLYRMLDSLSLCLSDEKLASESLCFSAINGQERTIEFIPTSQGLKPVIFAIRDITEMTMRNNLENTNSKLVSIGELAAGVAHELNTPLQYITDNLLYLQKIIAQTVWLEPALSKNCDNKLPFLTSIQELQVEGPAAIDDCIIGAQRMTRIVSAMKSYASPVDSNEIQIVEIGQIIRDAIELTTGSHKYVSQISYDNSLLPIWVAANHGSMTQVFINLINNACDAISERHEKNPNAPNGNIDIRLEIVKNKLLIKFSDNGGGIPENIRKNIFNLFFTTKPVGKGTGQGLAITLAIVKQCGGTISYQPYPPDGSLFVIELNLSQSLKEHTIESLTELIGQKDNI